MTRVRRVAQLQRPFVFACRICLFRVQAPRALFQNALLNLNDFPKCRHGQLQRVQLFALGLNRDDAIQPKIFFAQDQTGGGLRIENNAANVRRDKRHCAFFFDEKRTLDFVRGNRRQRSFVERQLAQPVGFQQRQRVAVGFIKRDVSRIAPRAAQQWRAKFEMIGWCFKGFKETRSHE